MENIIVYDSQYGNTEIIALAIAKEIPSTTAMKASDATPDDLKNIRLLVIGSPTQGGRPTVSMQQFLDGIPGGALKSMKVAAYDTRLREQDLGFALKLFVKTIGYAAAKMANTLQQKGGTLAVPPEGFFVSGREGPLAPGELERAKTWLKHR